jgi:hypothetical protein
MTKYHPKFITHYYKKGTVPFRSLSTLPDSIALALMRELSDETVFGARFQDPEGYLRNRKLSEAWLREAFIKKGGKPILNYPIYFVLGVSSWLEEHAPDKDLHSEIRVNLDEFDEVDVSFTYPDSMISFWLGKDKPADLYLPEFHGKVFTGKEILAIVDRMGDPEKDWDCNLPPTLAPYIEAQVWNKYPLLKYL